MATPEQQNDLGNLLNDIKGIDKDRLFRKTLGEESLENFAEPLAKFEGKVEKAVRLAPSVGDIAAFTSTARQIFNEINNQLTRSNPDFVVARSQFLENIKNFQEQLKQYWQPFVIAELEASGLLDDEGIKVEHQKAVEQMRVEAKNTIDEVKKAAEEVIEESKKFANSIEGKARQTAAKISVKDVQEQFSQAETRFKGTAGLWGAISAFVIIIFVLVAWKFEASPPTAGDVAAAVYHVALRLSVLTAIGATATFCLKIFRAQMHMREHNLHRQRIANSMPAFVESASTPEQRDIILSRLIESVSDFGNSGLIANSDDAINPTRMTIDSIAKNVTLPAAH